MQKVGINKGSDRVNYLDMAKGFAIFLVVVGHVYSDSSIKTWLYSFHLPLFFIVSGCLLNYKNEEKQNIKQMIVKKLKNLGVPYITFSIFVLFLDTIMSKFSIKVFMEGLKDTISLNGIDVMWFLPVLFTAELLFHIMIKLIKKEYIR